MTSKLMVALRVPGAPGRVFEAFVYEIGEWWQPNGLFDFTVGKHGTLAFEPGASGRLTETYDDGSVFEVGQITTWRQASFGPDMLTQVRVTFEPAGDETRVTVEHSGWDSVPQPHVARHGFPLGVFQQRHAEWWNALLRRLCVRLSPSA
jgi:hypothetical protein